VDSTRRGARFHRLAVSSSRLLKNPLAMACLP
jgi:hypothetical protein